MPSSIADVQRRRIKILEEQLENEKRKLNKIESSFPKDIDLYLHKQDEDMWSIGRDLNLSNQAQETFAYALSEVKITLNVNEDGTSTIIKINDVPTTIPVSA